MEENKRKAIEAKLNQLFTKINLNSNLAHNDPKGPTVVKVIRRRKGKPDLQVA
jgi:hypothetical protein